MAKKKVGEKTVGEKRPLSKGAADERPPEKRRPRRSRPRSKTAPSGTAPQAVGSPPGTSQPSFNALLGELRAMKQTLRQLVTKPTSAGGPPRRKTLPSRGDLDAGSTDAVLDGAVDSLRRLLSELIEQRMESVLRDLVDIRREAVTAANGQSHQLMDRLDRVLENLGAVRFDAEPLDFVDPLIHSVVDERCEKSAPDRVILDTVRPGYRTARGLVLCQAAVAVNRRS